MRLPVGSEFNEFYAKLETGNKSLIQNRNLLEKSNSATITTGLRLIGVQGTLRLEVGDEVERIS